MMGQQMRRVMSEVCCNWNRFSHPLKCWVHLRAYTNHHLGVQGCVQEIQTTLETPTRTTKQCLQLSITMRCKCVFLYKLCVCMCVLYAFFISIGKYGVSKVKNDNLSIFCFVLIFIFFSLVPWFCHWTRKRFIGLRLTSWSFYPTCPRKCLPGTFTQVMSGLAQ